MDVIKRAEMIENLVGSIVESTEEYQVAASKCPEDERPWGINVDRGHSKGAIINRCRVARQELLLICKQMESGELW